MLEEKIYIVDVDTSSLTNSSTQSELFQLIAAAFSDVFGLEFKVLQKRCSSADYSFMPLFDLDGNLFDDDIGFSLTSKNNSASAITTGGEYFYCSSYAPNENIMYNYEYTAYTRGTSVSASDSIIKFPISVGVRFFIDTRYLSSKGFYSIAYIRRDYTDAVVSPWFVITKCKDILENNEEHLGLIVFPTPGTSKTIRVGIKDTDNSIIRYAYNVRCMADSTKEDYVIMLKPIIAGRYIFDFYTYCSDDNEGMKSYSHAQNVSTIHDAWRDGIIIDGDHYLTTMRNINGWYSTNILFKKPE